MQPTTHAESVVLESVPVPVASQAPEFADLVSLSDYKMVEKEDSATDWLKFDDSSTDWVKFKGVFSSVRALVK